MPRRTSPAGGTSPTFAPPRRQCGARRHQDAALGAGLRSPPRADSVRRGRRLLSASVNCFLRNDERYLKHRDSRHCPCQEVRALRSVPSAIRRQSAVLEERSVDNQCELTHSVAYSECCCARRNDPTADAQQGPEQRRGPPMHKACPLSELAPGAAPRLGGGLLGGPTFPRD